MLYVVLTLIACMSLQLLSALQDAHLNLNLAHQRQQTANALYLTENALRRIEKTFDPGWSCVYATPQTWDFTRLTERFWGSAAACQLVFAQGTVQTVVEQMSRQVCDQQVTKLSRIVYRVTVHSKNSPVVLQSSWAVKGMTACAQVKHLPLGRLAWRQLH